MNDKPKKLNYTRELKNAMAAGAVIECAVAPYEGRAVRLDSGYGSHHPRPWVLVDASEYRFSGRECRVHTEGETS